MIGSLLFFALTVGVACAGHGSRSQLVRTVCGLIVPTVVALKLFPEAPHLPIPFILADTWAKFLIIFALHTPNALIIQDYRLDLGDGSLPARTTAAYKLLFNGRWVGTPLAAPGVAQSVQPASGARDQASRAAFIKRCILTIIAIAAVDTAKSMLVSSALNIGGRDLMPTKTMLLRRLSSVTPRELLIRASFAFDTAWTPFAWYTLLHSALSIIFVGPGLDTPEEWPPLFGSIAEAYSIRRFWARFYDRIVYRTLSTYAELLLRPLSDAKVGPMAGWRRVVLNFLIFAASGLLHAGVARHMGFLCGFWEEMSWWCLNFAAMMAEGAVQAACREMGGSKRGGVWTRRVGFAWVFGFLFWSVPKYQYPMMLCSPQANMAGGAQAAQLQAEMQNLVKMLQSSAHAG
jgi:hypothetical protein